MKKEQLNKPTTPAERKSVLFRKAGSRSETRLLTNKKTL